jgi:tetratricopeptide (TPR) repeat protein
MVSDIKRYFEASDWAKQFISDTQSLPRPSWLKSIDEDVRIRDQNSNIERKVDQNIIDAGIVWGAVTNVKFNYVINLAKLVGDGLQLVVYEKYQEASSFYDQAIRAYNELENICPEHIEDMGIMHISAWISEIWICKGLNLYKLGKYNEALECVEQALSLDPSFSNSLSPLKQSILQHIK